MLGSHRLLALTPTLTPTSGHRDITYWHDQGRTKPRTSNRKSWENHPRRHAVHGHTHNPAFCTVDREIIDLCVDGCSNGSISRFLANCHARGLNKQGKAWQVGSIDCSVARDGLPP
ncbi:hypothetical protein BDW72DRAFT_170371 [Aspergillus terricola var. indicus]